MQQNQEDQGEGREGTVASDVVESKATPELSAAPLLLTVVRTSFGSCITIGPFPSRGVRKETNACIYADGISPEHIESDEIGKRLYASAQLFAAAPALYAALKVAQGEWWRINGCPDLECTVCKDNKIKKAQIDAALALANGQATASPKERNS